MKQLINKANPKIRIIAEEIEVINDKYCVTYYSYEKEELEFNTSVNNWTLSDYYKEPIEWTDEDEFMFHAVLDVLEQSYCKGHSVWLQNLKDRFCKQPQLTVQYGTFESHAMWACINALCVKPVKDGNQWSFLYGENIQEGICGFGDTIFDAAKDFYKNILTETLKKE